MDVKTSYELARVCMDHVGDESDFVLISELHRSSGVVTLATTPTRHVQ